jgi:phosphate transport system substrate-binding protein
VLALLLTFGLVAAACGDDDSDSSSDTTSGDSSAIANLTGTLNGSGSSFQNNLQQACRDQFNPETDGATVNYNSVGSGQGKTDLAGQVTDFAGSDSLVKDEDKASFQGGDFLYFPIAAGPVTVSYNLDVDGLQLSPDTLAGIMQGDITTWDASEIAADNPDATLPSTAITIVHRSDGSGTTSGFTGYLEKAAPDTWTLGSGDSVDWPADSQAGEKNTGVAQIINDTDGAIGYVDFSDAEAVGLTYAAIQNQDGEYVAPSLDAASSALAGADITDDLTVDALDASGADAYPIVLPTYMITYTTYSDQTVGDLLTGYLGYMLNECQDIANENGYAKLPDQLQSDAVSQIDDITVG